MKALDFMVGEADLVGLFTCNCEVYAPPSWRLVTAVYRKFHAHEIRHPIYKRVNVVFTPNAIQHARLTDTPASKTWINAWYRVSVDRFNNANNRDRCQIVAESIFESALLLFPDESRERAAIISISDEFESHYESQVMRFLAREKQMKRYSVLLSYDINWGDEGPMYVAYVEYKTAEFNRFTSFELKGSDDDIFELAGSIVVKDRCVVLKPRSTAIPHLKRLKYACPLVFPIDEMREGEC